MGARHLPDLQFVQAPSRLTWLPSKIAVEHPVTAAPVPILSAVPRLLMNREFSTLNDVEAESPSPQAVVFAYIHQDLGALPTEQDQGHEATAELRTRPSIFCAAVEPSWTNGFRSGRRTPQGSRDDVASLLMDPGSGVEFLPAATSLSAQQIGRCGELLVQYRLLRHGVESASLTTDSGIDLVAYSAGSRSAFTIQVKSNLSPKPGGGKGKLALDWWIPEDSPAQLHALVDLSKERIWVFRHGELLSLAQRRSQGRVHFYMYVDESVLPRGAGRRVRVSDFDGFLFEHRIGALVDL